MARRKKSTGGTKVKGRKKVTVDLIARKRGDTVATPYKLMEEIVEAHHPHLRDAKIAIAWRHGKKADSDGRIWLGQAKKGSDLDRALHGFDFVLLLNHEAWNANLSEAQMRALLDHELCHCAVVVDTNGEPKVDEKGRTVYRLRKHDIEEFRDVVARHGLWKEDIREFVEAAIKAEPDLPLFPEAKKKSKAGAKPSANGNGKHDTNGHAEPSAAEKRAAGKEAAVAD